MIDEINDVLTFLSENKQMNSARQIEFNLIHRYKNKMEWEQLSSGEKQNKRKSVLKAVKKYKEEDGLETYTYENAVIGFYDACSELLNELPAHFGRSLLVKRLKLVLIRDMESIDSDTTFFNKKVMPFIVYEGLFRELEEEQIKFKAMSQLLENVKILSQSMPPIS